MTDMDLPLARNKDITVQELENETLIYDLTIDKAYCLNETSSIVFSACGSRKTFEYLKNKYKFTDDLINLALEGLKTNDLLAREYASPFAGMSRRALIRKVGTASMIALPLISVIIAPPAAQATSTRPCSCCVRAGQLICRTCRRTDIVEFAGFTRTGTCTIPDGGNGRIDCSGTDGTDTRDVCVL